MTINKKELRKAKRLVADYDLCSPTLISTSEINETESIQKLVDFIKELIFKKEVSDSTRIWMKKNL